MAVKRLLVDPFTRAELGRGGLEELSRNLWPGCCQTCGEGLGDEAPSVVVTEALVSVTATLHHRRCQRPRWSRAGSAAWGRFLTVSTSLVSVPFGDAGRDTWAPTLVVNPGLEQVELVCGEGGYRAATVDTLRPAGFRPPAEGIGRSVDRSVESWLADDRLIVRFENSYWVVPFPDRTQSLIRQVDAFGGVVLALSTAVEPARVDNPEPIKRILRAGDVALVEAVFTEGAPVPEVYEHSVIIESDLAHADEADSFDWIPEAEYPGPSYDPDSGFCTVGMGMDGPARWRLTVPDGGVANGLIVMPAGMGKTNLLRLVVMEAVCSGLFRYGQIGLRDRRPLIDVPGGRPDLMAETPEQALDLLSAFARVVDVRLTRSDEYRVVDRDHPGMLLAIDDAQDVLCEAAAAEKAAYIAVRGPVVGVGLVVSAASSALRDFGGRGDLIRALARTNAVLRSLEDVEAVKRIQAGP